MPKKLALSINGKIYESIKEASRVLGIDTWNIYTRLNSDLILWKDWSFIDGNKHSIKKQEDDGLFYVYKLLHKPTGSFYIGSTKDYLGRKSTHLYNLRRGRHVNHKLQNLWRNSNEDQWEWHVWVFEEREEAYSEEQKELTKYADSSLLLNVVLDAKSPISHLMKQDGFKDMLAKSRAEHLMRLTEDETQLLRQKWSDASKKYWATGDNRKDRMGAGNPFAKKVSVDGIIYGSVKDAQKALGINEKTIRKRANSPDYPNYTFDISVEH